MHSRRTLRQHRTWLQGIRDHAAGTPCRENPRQATSLEQAWADGWEFADSARVYREKHPDDRGTS